MPNPVFDFAIALFIGALVGIEREKKQAGEPERGIGGLRTFILIAMAGAVAAWLSVQLKTPWIFIVTGVVVAATALTGYVIHTRAHPEWAGVTTEVAAIVVYLLGGTTLFGYPQAAVALAIAVAAVLAYKAPLHELVQKLGQDDLYAGLQLLIATFIVLPVLPDKPVDPWGAINPHRLWLLVVLISSLSLVGYVATRLLGARLGTSLTGLFGGLVSSTAVTLAFARQSREQPAERGMADALASGLLLAWAVMAARMAVMLAVVQRALLAPLGPALATLGGLALGLALVFYWRGARPAPPTARPPVPLKNPFSLVPAVKFALLFMAVLLLVKLVQQHLAGPGLYAVAGLAGLTDVDAITLSMADYFRTGGAARVAAAAIVIAALSNTLAKCGLVLALGAPALRPRIVAATAVLVVGTAVVFVVA